MATKVNAAQINASIEKNSAPIDTAAVAQEAQAKQLQQERPHLPEPKLFVPTNEQVKDSFDLAMDLLAECFQSEDERAQTRIDNETGEEIEDRKVVNVLGFYQSRVLGGVIWSIQNALDWLDDHRNDYGRPALLRDLRMTLQRQERGADVDDALNAINSRLERADMNEAELIFRRGVAMDAYERIIGRPYVAPGSKATAKVQTAERPAVTVSPAVAAARARLNRG